MRKWSAMISATDAAPGEGTYHGLSLRYLIARHEHNRLELLTVAAKPSGETLPVFCTERAALDFLRRGGFGGDWWVRESTAGELVSLLFGHLAVDRVALDPPSELAATEEAKLPGTSKKEFIAALMG
jgi:hypothetical protein